MSKTSEGKNTKPFSIQTFLFAVFFRTVLLRFENLPVLYFGLRSVFPRQKHSWLPSTEAENSAMPAGRSSTYHTAESVPESLQFPSSLSAVANVVVPVTTLPSGRRVTPHWEGHRPNAQWETAGKSQPQRASQVAASVPPNLPWLIAPPPQPLDVGFNLLPAPNRCSLLMPGNRIF